ncbi:MAG: adenosylmethionine decarboxylase [Betaproteobacteria bacterium]|nr:adenosylmethionine decarboxylase [Betaproteobacteria bacterium]MBA3775304.1 adenosylmethionine decarboxylase [Betaproteobacteria bacterium]
MNSNLAEGTAYEIKLPQGTGFHVVADWYDCGKACSMSASELRALCLREVMRADLRALGESFHQFEPQGVTGTVVLAESHLAIHTWPESGYTTIDVFVCNFQEDNTHKALRLFAALRRAFAPQHEQVVHLQRGQNDGLQSGNVNEPDRAAGYGFGSRSN